MPKFGELLPADVWAAATRTLTDISAEEIFDLPIADAFVPTDDELATTSATPDAFGSWVELIADVGVGKRLLGFSVYRNAANDATVEVEIGSGGGGSEAAIARAHLHAGAYKNHMIENIWLSLTDNIRLSVRVRNSESAAIGYFVIPHLA